MRWSGCYGSHKNHLSDVVSPNPRGLLVTKCNLPSFFSLDTCCTQGWQRYADLVDSFCSRSCARTGMTPASISGVTWYKKLTCQAGIPSDLTISPFSRSDTNRSGIWSSWAYLPSWDLWDDIISSHPSSLRISGNNLRPIVLRGWMPRWMLPRGGVSARTYGICSSIPEPPWLVGDLTPLQAKGTFVLDDLAPDPAPDPARADPSRW